MPGGLPFAVWPSDRFETKGETGVYENQRFCSACGSRMFSANDEEAQIKVGILTDAPTPLKPPYELWVKRRERWLNPVEGAEQHQEDRL